MTSTTTNPLAVFLENALPPDRVPVPLKLTTFDIKIEAGLAIVTTTRLFENTEASAIEATLTFPVPVHAVLFSLDVRIGERHLQASAEAKETARITYEEGLENGKTAILHEELLRGIHMLSVGNILPGQEIEVKTIWATSLMMAAGEGHLRIPTTVGQIYGQSPLADGDDFTWGHDVPLADVTVWSSEASVTIGGHAIGAEPFKVRMNQPIDLTVGGWQPTRLTSRFVSGHGIEMELIPTPASSLALNLAILVDHSSSMAQAVSHCDRGKKTIHDLIISALTVLSERMANEDFIDLWEFSHKTRQIGQSTDNKPSLASLIEELTPPDGGTEINEALLTVLGTTQANSILLITDGRSHAVDVQALAGQGKRISVLLVGEDSLEAQIGYLAALTGGDIFVAPKNSVDKVLSASLNSLRSPTQMGPRAGSSEEIEQQFSLSGMMIHLRRTGEVDATPRSTLEHGIAALAANLQLPQLSEEDATKLAAAEGLVTHLTSLVLIDEAKTTQDSIPLRRRIPLAPAKSSFAFAQSSASFAPRYRMASSIVSPLGRDARRGSIISRFLDRFYKRTSLRIRRERPQDAFRSRLEALAIILDWDECVLDPSHSWIARLNQEIAEEFRQLTRSPAVIKLSHEQSLDVLLIVVFLLTKRASALNDRSATRVMLRLRKELTPSNINAILLLDS